MTSNGIPADLLTDAAPASATRQVSMACQRDQFTHFPFCDCPKQSRPTMVLIKRRVTWRRDFGKKGVSSLASVPFAPSCRRVAKTAVPAAVASSAILRGASKLIA
jgi:hypothetical protein